MSVASLLRQGQHLLARAFPATVTIGDHDYLAATAGLRRDATLAEGPGDFQRRISFWFPVQLLTAAGQPVPRELSPLVYQGAEYQIESVMLDPGQINVTLNCVQQPQ